MSQLIDEISVGACIVSRQGEVLHQNLSLEFVYAEEPQAEALRALVARVGKSLVLASIANKSSGVSQTNRAICEHFHGPSNCYEIRGTLLEHQAIPDAAAIVFVEARHSDALRRRKAASRVRAEFHLTSRETEVALLLARRMTAEEIAKALGISVHTARHHTENVFLKTAVTSRSKIAELFDQDQSPRSTETRRR
jgi:DNA-binding CsgD family transcriptional regulator